VSPTGELVPLGVQDRGRWVRRLRAEGHALVRARLASGEPPGRYQLLAAINAVHTDGDAPDWRQIVALYDQLTRLDPSPLVRLSRAVAVGQRDGAAEGLRLLDELATELEGYHGYHAARADLLRQLGRTSASREAYGTAIALAGNTAEVAYLGRRRDGL
jgi:RNA polymerase sigma-70 factor (ECF subfamily)